MDNRKYNIYFNTHTVSGIIICAILYVMFFAGSFTFFKDDITAWQKNDALSGHHLPAKKDLNYLIDSLGKKHKLKGRDFDFTLHAGHSTLYVGMSASHDSTVKKAKEKDGRFGGRRGRGEDRTADNANRKTIRGVGSKTDTTMLAANNVRSAKNDKAEVRGGEKKDGADKKERRGRGRRGDDDSAYFSYDFSKHQEADYASGYTMGEFLYRLHFLAQVNQVLPFRIGVPFGYLLAGIVSFIFLFALITGLLLHWDKLVTNFFTFRPWNKWKNVWTELHTVLGVIGFPYQLVFAVTGIVLIFNSFLIIPYTKLFYKGDQQKIFKDLGFGVKADYPYTYKALTGNVDMDSLVNVVQKQKQWERSELSLVAIRNYGDANMHVIIKAKPTTTTQMNGEGEWIYRVRDRRVIANHGPAEPAGYFKTFKGMIYHLHFGDYGGRPLKVIYFVLGILGCIVINSGVMIWLVARDKNNVPERKKKFNFLIANIYLSSSLSLLPVTGITMIALLFIDEPGRTDIYHWFFYSWLVLGVYLMIRRNLDLVNRQTTLLSAVICLLVPVMDGAIRGNWFWTTYQRSANSILFIDVLFLILGILSAVVYWKMSQKKAIPPAQAAARPNKVKMEAVPA